LWWPCHVSCNYHLHLLVCLFVCLFVYLFIYYFVIFCNENEPDALFILNLFRQSTSACFGHIYCPSSGGIHCICTAVGTCQQPVNLNV
jgi:hypothetical protein